MNKGYKYIDKKIVTKIDNLDQFYPGINMVLVKSAFDTSTIGDEIKIYVDTAYGEIEHASRIVRVVKIPPFLSIKGRSHYNESFINALDWYTEIELLPGDLAWVDPLSVINNNNTVDTNVYLYEGEIYFAIRYDKFIAAKRDNKVVMLNGYILIEKIWQDSEEDIFMYEPISYYSKIAYVGKPNSYYYNSWYSDDVIIKENDIIINPDHMITLEHDLHREFDNDRKFYVIQRRHIPVIIKQDET